MTTMSHTDDLPLPTPPLCAVLPETAAHSGDRCMISLRAGIWLPGRVLGLDLDAGMIRWQPANEGAAETQTPFSDIKLVYFPDPRPWVPAIDERSEAGSSMEFPEARQDFEIKFLDGDSLKGFTMGCRQQVHALLLYPSHKPGKFIYGLIPADLVAEWRVGPQIGHILVQQGAVRADEVQSALDWQETQREVPIGTYLLNNALVTAQDLEKALSKQHGLGNVRLGEVLIADGLVTPQQLHAALQEQHHGRALPIGEILVRRGHITPEQVQRALARKLGIPLVDLQHFPIGEDARRLVPAELVRKHRVLPVYRYGNKLVLAQENPLHKAPQDEIAFVTRLFVEPVMAPQTEIDRAIHELYPELEEPLDDGTLAAFAPEPEADAEEPPGGGGFINDNVVVRLVHRIILQALEAGASDIHIEPHVGEARAVVRLRRDGLLVQAREFPSALRHAVIARLKVMAGLDTTIRNRPQDGKIVFGQHKGRKIGLRLATLPTAGRQEDAVLRVLVSGEAQPLAAMSFSLDNLERVTGLIHHNHGLLLVCGPTGSGKTTTLHSLLRELNTPARKIWTAEDPVEVTQKGLRQVQVQPQQGLSFAAALRAFLRADPDVIMVGEMRDTETARTAIEASLTGHLVLSTLHTNSAAETLTRLLDMGLDPFSFTDALRGVVAQRLVPRLCTRCREPHEAGHAELLELAREYCHDFRGLAESGLSQPESPEGVAARWQATSDGPRLHHARGCPACAGSGYAGRIGLHEVLLASPAIRRAILDGKSASVLHATALAEGMHTLKQDGIGKVLLGLTDITQVRRVCA
jgi:type II secretory ATPase GspE/PulE/Tfp pilus assembly ATPase PilB-like protein